MTGLAYGVCVASWDRLQRYAVPWTGTTLERPLLALSGQPSIAAGYNAILNACADRGFDGLVLMHDDLEITDLLFEDKVLAELSSPDVVLVGVAGGGPALRWWHHEPIGHQMTDSGIVDFGPRAGDVDILEGSVIAFSPWAVENLRCDERYTDFRSGWDDVCLTARKAGKRVVVVDADTHHHSTLGFKSQQIEEAFMESERLFAEKWGA